MKGDKHMQEVLERILPKFLDHIGRSKVCTDIAIIENTGYRKNEEHVVCYQLVAFDGKGKDRKAYSVSYRFELHIQDITSEIIKEEVK